jgi:endonuclease/exonuclease/phosphatase family metal-dependent hydrolase
MLALGVAQRLAASVILSEAFNYSDGVLVSVSSGTWVHHSGSTTGEVKVVSGRVFLCQTNSEDVSAFLSGEPYLPSTNAMLYTSFTVNFVSLPSGQGDYFAHFKTSGTSGFNDKLFVTTNGVPAGFFRLGIANGATSPLGATFLNSNLSPSTDYTLVTRYSVSNSFSTLWVNPSAETDPGINATDVANQTNTITTFALRESLAGGNGMGSLYVDNLMVGTSFADVVPSGPATPPFITGQPQNQTVSEGSTATFSVQAAGTAPLSYQWQFNSTNLLDGTNATLTLLQVTTNQAGPYAVIITNTFGVTNSPTVTLTVTPLMVPPSITNEPQSETVTAGADVSFSVAAMGTTPFSYQWHFYDTNLPGATDATLSLLHVSTNQSGPYSVTVSNSSGTTNSQVAQLTVIAAPAVLSVMTYNVKGNGATNWSVDTPQLQAIGRQVMFLQPDIITFNEIPSNYTWQMTNFVAAFLPGYHLATNSGTDGFIRSVIVSRFPIIFSQKWLDGVSLAAFGYNGNFTRDLFQAQVAVPGFAQPVDVFVTHLKATVSTPQDDANKRAAEASAVSNFFATVYLPGTNGLHPYLLNGDLNEDVLRPETNRYVSGQPVQRLVSAPTGLELTTPVNPFSQSDLTESIQTTLNVRFDYILPCGLLFSNVVSSQVFRTDLLPNPPPPLLPSDDKTASDHLPVVMMFANPYNRPFKLTSVARTNQVTRLTWESVRGQLYRVDTSSNLSTWAVLADNLVATSASFTFTTNLPAPQQFFRVRRGP